MSKFSIGDHVLVTPEDDDDFFTHEFIGTVVGHRDGRVLVRDQDDDVFEAEEEQVSPYGDDE